MKYPSYTGTVLKRRYPDESAFVEIEGGLYVVRWNRQPPAPTPEQITEWALEDLEAIANERIEEEQERRAGGGKAVTRDELFLVVRDLYLNAIKPAARNPINENTPVLLALQNWRNKQQAIKAKAAGYQERGRDGCRKGAGAVRPD